MVELFIKHGADLEATDENGTALQVAAIKGIHKMNDIT